MRRLALACMAALGIAHTAEAHALDEYVQALRVDVGSARLAVYLDLTPGANIASQVLRRIDEDGDNVLSPAEVEKYGRAVIADLAVSLDGADVALSLARVETPSTEELKSGQGIIRIETSTRALLSSGRHRVVVFNGHLPRSSVYLANALLPDSETRILQQWRDTRQQTFSVDYEIRGADRTAFAWLLAASTILSALVYGRHGFRS
jgi:hypothetical protein